MSSQRGNTARTRAQKHKNSTVFKNDMHDKTVKTKMINSINICNVCERCKGILEWKIKYKKYKPLTAPKKCTQCEEKTIKHAYHMLCQVCASKAQVCPKCGKEKIAFEEVAENKDLDRELQTTIEALTERKRRTFYRYLAKKSIGIESTSLEEKSDMLAKLKDLKLSSKSKDDTFSSDSEFDDDCNSEFDNNEDNCSSSS